ncbi:MAG: hypothetical protein JWQ43_1689, partial [Glaciihabitans sp.]|nr:hypothetical protein [Glaciihabitans sp.]
KMLRDHRSLIVRFADKAAVRDYVTAVVGAHYLPQVYAILDDPADLAGIDLPASYVLKPTHGSGAVVVVSDDADGGTILPRPDWSWIYAHVRPEAADRAQLVAIGRYWLSKLYGQGPNKEWAYSQLTPRIIVEELLVAPTGTIPDDYKFFVFDRKVHFIQVDAGRFGPRTQDFYDRDWNHLEMSGGLPWDPVTRQPPTRLREMIDLAERLAADTDFVRVDLYHFEDRVVFGELTSYPAGGHSPFIPESWNDEFGRRWSVPRKYRDN